MARKVSYSYYKAAMLAVWALAILCVIGTWIGFCIANKPSIVYASIVDAFLTLALVALVVLLGLNERKDYKKRAWLFGILCVAHTAFFIAVLCLSDRFTEGNMLYLLLPGVHTILLIIITILGVYFWIRNKFKFKSFEQQDAIEAFGGSIEEPKPAAPEQPALPPDEEPKKGRDEKTGIVSL